MGRDVRSVGGFVVGRSGREGQLWAGNLAELIGAFGLLGKGRYWIRFVMVDAGADVRRIASNGVGDWGCVAIIKPGSWVLANDVASVVWAEEGGPRT